MAKEFKMRTDFKILSEWKKIPRSWPLKNGYKRVMVVYPEGATRHIDIPINSNK